MRLCDTTSGPEPLCVAIRNGGTMGKLQDADAASVPGPRGKYFFSGAIDCKSRGIAPYRKWLPKRGKILDALAFHKKACVSSGESFFLKKKK